MQSPEYIGVASLLAEGRIGFTRVRTPHVKDTVAEQTARDSAHLVQDPLELLRDQLAAIEAAKTAAQPVVPAQPVRDAVPAF